MNFRFEKVVKYFNKQMKLNSKQKREKNGK